LWLAYGLRGWLIQRRNPGAPHFLRWLRGLGLTGLVGVVLSAPLWLPLLEYIPLTTRAVMTATERIGISLPPANLLGLFVPSMGSYAEWELYAGALPWLLLIFTLAVPALRRQAWFWLVVLAASLLAAFGEAIPGYTALSSLPGFSLLRVPTRSLFVCGMAFAAVTGFALEYLLQNKVEQKPEPVFFMVPFTAFPLLIAGGMIFYLGGYSLPFLWGGIAMLVGLFAILALEKRWLPVGTGLAVLVLVMVFEMIGTDASSISLKKPAEVLDRDAELLARIVPKAGDHYRIYSPSFSLSQSVTAHSGVELVEGIDPMQLKSYVAWFGQASGVPVNGYSVTMPPLENGEPLLDNAGYTPDASLLGLLNTKYVLAAFPLRANDLEWIDQAAGVQIYENLAYRERAWVENGDGEIGVATILEYQANRVVLSAVGPGTLVLSDVYYPGWQAQVDGETVAIQPYQNLLRSVVLGPGEHQVVFTFRPVLVSIGWGCGLAGWLLILALAIKQRRVSRNVRQ
ncbi:YfhO family protein, partial [bacterium]